MKKISTQQRVKRRPLVEKSSARVMAKRSLEPVNGTTLVITVMSEVMSVRFVITAGDMKHRKHLAYPEKWNPNRTETSRRSAGA